MLSPSIISPSATSSSFPFEFNPSNGYLDSNDYDLVSIDDLFTNKKNNNNTISKPQSNLSSVSSNAPTPAVLLPPVPLSPLNTTSGKETFSSKSVSGKTPTSARSMGLRPPITPTAAKSPSITELLKRKDISSKVIGSKRPCFTESDFPPVALVNTTTPSTSNHGKKLQTNSSRSSNNLAGMNLSSNVTQSPYNTSFHKYTSSASSATSNHLFVPSAVTCSSLSSQTHSFRCDLQLEEILNQIDSELKQIAEGSQDPHYEAYKSYSTNSFTAYHTIYQQMYVFYNPLEFSWRLLYSKAAEQCEMKIFVHRLMKEENERNPELEAFEVTHYLLRTELVQGDRALYEFIFQHVKESVGTTDDSWGKDVTVTPQSKSLLLAPQDYYYEQRKLSDPLSCLGGNFSRSVSVSLPSSGKFSSSSSAAAAAEVTMTEFYEDPTNIEQIELWTEQILQYDSPEQQREAIRCLCHVIHGAHHEKRMFDLLESLHLVENLMTVFLPQMTSDESSSLKPAATAPAVTGIAVPFCGGHGDGLMELEDIFWVKPLIIQILLYFTDRAKAVKTMLDDKAFIGFITSVTESFQQQEQEMKKKLLSLTPKSLGSASGSGKFSVTPSSAHSSLNSASNNDTIVAMMQTQSLPLSWLKLYKDCARLSDEIAKMISLAGSAEEEESMMGLIRHTSSEDFLSFSNLFSSPHHHKAGGGGVGGGGVGNIKSQC